MTEDRKQLAAVSRVLVHFTEWLDTYGETSWDYQSFFAGPMSGRAKSLYYRNQLLGTAAVAPMIFCEALLPSGAPAVSSSHSISHRGRPLCDGFCFPLRGDREFVTSGKRGSLSNRAQKVALSLTSRNIAGVIPSIGSLANGMIKEQTPLITTTPYCYEAFLQVFELHCTGRVESSSRIDCATCRC